MCLFRGPLAPIGVPAGYASSTKLSNLPALKAPSVPLTPAAPPWLTLRPSSWPPRHTECASTQCASHLPKVGHVETGESDTMTTPVYSAVATTGRNYRTSAEAQKPRGKRPLSPSLRVRNKGWPRNERDFWDTPSWSFQPTIPILIRFLCPSPPRRVQLA